MVQNTSDWKFSNFKRDRKDFAPNASVLEAASLSPYLCSSTTTANVNKATATATATATAPTSENNQLRCPRCDSSNTKFCYYNNYNLTQPRHFCKACRRYWTKGGALRNVPIGGGCRRNHKNTYIPTAPLGKPSSSTASGKFSSFNVTDHINGNKSPGFHSGYSQQEHLLPLSNISSWASPQRSQLLALLRSTQNPNPTLDSFKVKEGDKGFIFGSQMRFDQQRDEGSLGFDSLKNSSYCRNNNHNQQENGYMVQNRIISDHLYQRLGLESSANYLESSANYCSDNLQAVDMNSNSSAILESASVTTSFSWFDLLARNGGYL